MSGPFRRVAIVNRGEAAMRFIHAAREYEFEHGYVEAGTFFGTLVEEVEAVNEDGDLYVLLEQREVPIPIASILEVETVKRGMSSNAIYVASAVGAGGDPARPVRPRAHRRSASFARRRVPEVTHRHAGA